MTAAVDVSGNEGLKHEADNVAESKDYADIVIGAALELKIDGRKAEYNAAQDPVDGLQRGIIKIKYLF